MDTIEDVFKHFLSRYNAFRQKQFEIIERPQPSLFRTRDAAAGEERSFETYRLDDDEFRSTTKRYLELQKRGLPYEQMVQEMGVGAGASSYRAVEYTLAEAMAGRLATLAQLERPPAPPVTIVLWTDPLSFPEGMFFPSHFEPSRTNLEYAERLIANRLRNLLHRTRFEELFVFEHQTSGTGGLREILLSGAA